MTDVAQKMLNDLWRDLQLSGQRREMAEIKAEPNKHQMTRLMATGANTGYSYWPAGARTTDRTRQECRICVTYNRNAAGNFLIFREVVKFNLRKDPKTKRPRKHWHQSERFDFSYADSKKEAHALAAKRAARWKLENPKWGE